MNLQQLLERREALDLDRVFFQIISAVEKMHDDEIVHGHLTPRDILVKTDGSFEIVNSEPERLPFRLDAKAKELEFLSPEQLRGKKPTRKSDMYALGVIGYRLFTGRFPFTGDSLAITSSTLYQKPDVPRSEIPQRYREFLIKTLAKSPRKRPRGYDARPPRFERARVYGIVGIAVLGLLLTGYAVRTVSQKAALAKQASKRKTKTGR